MAKTAMFGLVLGMCLAAAFSLSSARTEGVSGRPHLPERYIDTAIDTSPVTGKTIRVGNGCDLQHAIDSANPGDEIVLQSGAVFSGNYTLRAKQSGSGWITIRSSEMAHLPKPGTRVNPSMSVLMPRVMAQGTAPAFFIAARAAKYRLIGLEITVPMRTPLNYGLVMSGDPLDSNANDLPQDIILDRSYIHGQPLCHCKFGVQMNGISYAVVDSYLSEFHGFGQDTQGIFAYIDPGPLKIVNNYIEASGENVLFGGDYAAIPGMIASDVEIRNNYLSKPLQWMDSVIPAPRSVTATISGGGALTPLTTYYYAIVARGTAGTLTEAGSAQSSGSREAVVGPQQGRATVTLHWSGVHYGSGSDVRHADSYEILRTTDSPTAKTRRWLHFPYVPPDIRAPEFFFSDKGEAPGQPWSGWPRRWTVKNLFEIKNGQRFFIDGNIFENNWLDAQNGFAILLTPRVQTGPSGRIMDHNAVRDITFTNNIVRHSGSGVNILSSDNLAPASAVHGLAVTERIYFANNLFEDIDGSAYNNSNGFFLGLAQGWPELRGACGLSFDHNSIFQTGNIMNIGNLGGANPPYGTLSFTNNVVPNNAYGIHVDGAAGDWKSIRRVFSEADISGNLFIGAPETNRIPGNLYTASRPNRVQGWNKGDPGVNFEVLEKRTAASVSGSMTPAN